MSISGARMPSPEPIGKPQASLEIPKRAARPVPPRKPLATAVGKSKIPKHEKIASKDGTNNQEDGETPAKEKPEERGSALAASSRRPTSRSKEKPAQTMSQLRGNSSQLSTGSSASQKRILENLFKSRKIKYISLKTEIEDKQKSSEVAYQELFQLRERILEACGKEPGRLDELAPLPGWSARVRKQLAGVTSAPLELPGLDHEDAGFVANLETVLRAIVDPPLASCAEALGRQTAGIARLQALLGPDSDDGRSGFNLKDELSKELEVQKSESSELESQLETRRQEQYSRISELVRSVSSLWHECQSYRRQQQQLKANSSDSGPGPQASEEVAKELRCEKERLFKARTRIRDLEGTLASGEAKLRQAQEHARQLEAQLKQKEASLEQKVKELGKYQRINETMQGKLEKQKGTVESRMTKLKDDLEAKENEFKVAEDGYKKRLADLERDLEHERSARQEIEVEFEEFKARHEKLEEKCKQLLEVVEKTKQVISDDQHTDNEIRLFNDLKETKKMLSDKEKMIKKLEMERDEMLAAVSEEADGEKNQSKQWLAAELLKKSKELESMSSQFLQSEKNYRKLLQKSERLEQMLGETKRGKAGSYELVQLQQQVTDLRGSLAEERGHGAELERTCTQLQLKLEHCQRCLRSREQGLRLRTELQQLLRNEEQQQQQQTAAADEIQIQEQNKAASEDYQQLYSALETKEMQLMKLEKLVKQMEKQEEYSQLQRTRLEQRIGKLELALKDSRQADRNRGFSFL